MKNRFSFVAAFLSLLAACSAAPDPEPGSTKVADVAASEAARDATERAAPVMAPATCTPAWGCFTTLEFYSSQSFCEAHCDPPAACDNAMCCTTPNGKRCTFN